MFGIAEQQVPPNVELVPTHHVARPLRLVHEQLGGTKGGLGEVGNLAQIKGGPRIDFQDVQGKLALRHGALDGLGLEHGQIGAR